MIFQDRYPFSVLLSVIVFFALFLYTYRIRKAPGAIFLLIMMALHSLQGILCICELMADSLERKLFWLNMQQIPLCYSPVMLLGIIMTNMGTPAKVLARRIVILSGIMLLYWILLFTDPYHHLIRERVWVEPFGEFEHIGVERTNLGDLFFALINMLALWGLALLLINYKKATGIQKRQYVLMVLAALFPIVLLWLARLFGWPLTVAVSILPSSLLIFYALHMYKFLQVRPLAKEKVLEHMSEGILILDEQGQIIDANPAARILQTVSGKSNLIGAYLGEWFANQPGLQALYESGEQGKTEAEIGGLHFEVRFVPIHVRGRRTGALLIFAEITDRKKYEEELIRRATTDGLTELYNRCYFLERLEKARKECEASGAPISLMLIDLDHFKEINDRYGHMAGDRVLRHFAALLKEATAEKGTAGRWGGEEFALFLPGTDGKTAYTMAEAMRLRVQREPLVLNEAGKLANIIPYSISVGVAELKDPRMTNEAWLSLADSGLYRSKQNGRNQTTLAE